MIGHWRWCMLSIYGLLCYCDAIDEDLAPLRSPCSSSVQCVGVAVCIEGFCRCPVPYMVIGNTCVHSGFESDFTPSKSEFSDSQSADKEPETDQTDKPSVFGSSSQNKYPSVILDKIQTTTSASFQGYPGQACGENDTCKGNSFCYKGTCSCHSGAVVSGRTCANMNIGPKLTKPPTSNSKPKIKVTIRPIPKANDHESLFICPPPSTWIDGECTDPKSSSAAITGNSDPEMEISVPKGFCKPPLAVVDGWCVLPSKISRSSIDNAKEQSTSPPEPFCQPPNKWFQGRCIAPVSANPLGLPTHYLFPPHLSAAPNILPTMMNSDTAVRRCSPGEVLIDGACVSTSVIVNYPTPLLCSTENDCPGGSTCLSYFCVCPSPFIWHSRVGCDLSSLELGETIESEVQDQTAVDPGFFNYPSRVAKELVRLGGRCNRDADCVEKAVCEHGLCACRSPFIPYLSICVYAPTQDETEAIAIH